MEALTEKLLNDYQRDFPLSPAPFAQIAARLDTDTDTVITRLRQLQARGAVSRVGPVFRPNTVGASTLAAMDVPSSRLEQVAGVINGFAEVNHNYEREHHYNLWFVVTAPDRMALLNTLDRIKRRTGYRLLSLPLIRDYHIDLGFSMRLGDCSEPVAFLDAPGLALADDGTDVAPAAAEDLIAAIQSGLPLVARPYRAIAKQLGCSEYGVIERLRQLLASGVIKRLGVVVRHHELGYRANAMVVWDVPDERIDTLGEQIGRQDCVTLCYQRPRRLPDWPYNLFCMVHGRDREAVSRCVEAMVDGLDLRALDRAVLFSGRRFKQRGARYRTGH